MSVAAYEIRRSARLILLDSQGRLMLFRYHDGYGAPFWATAGGELRAGEDYRQAAERELAEETGFDAKIGRFLVERDEVYAVTASRPARWIEHYFLVNCPVAAVPSKAGWTDEERSTIQSFRWWSVEEMREEGRGIEGFFRPDWLPEILQELRG